MTATTCTHLQPPCTHLDIFMASDIGAQIGGPAILITIRPGPVLHVWHCGKEAAAVPLTPSATLTLCSDLLAALAGDMQP